MTQVEEREGYRLLVRSIGTAGATAVTALRGLRVGSDENLASLLYRAPSVLAGGLDRETGQKLCQVLGKTGLELALLSPQESFEPGTDDFEVALVIDDPSKVTAVIEETVTVLGVDVETAKRVVIQSPAALIGGVSEATVVALTERYRAFDVGLDVSRRRDAQFDVAIEAADGRTRAAATAVLREVGAVVSAESAHHLLGTGLSLAAAERVWPDLARSASKVRILNRDLQRFDVRLEKALDTPEVRSFLTETVGMPERLVGRALARTPLVLRENVSGREMTALLEGAQAVGASATGILLALQGFALDIKPGGDRQSARGWVYAIAGREAAAEFTDTRPCRLGGPLTKLQARWLQHELRKHGVSSELVAR
ncbi:MAG: hypothetical protein OEZ06_01815 [Myxococcales bacterium]|nr:hypothetical protein [Myxococcales bacterium]